MGGSILGGSIRAQSALRFAGSRARSRLRRRQLQRRPIAALISAGGFTTNQAIGSVVVHGNVSGGKILAGYQNNGSPLSADAQIGLVQVDGNVKAFDVVAGAAAGSDSVFGSHPAAAPLSVRREDHRRIDNAVFSRIARVIIGGHGASTTARSHGIVAQEVDAVSVGGTALRLTGAPNETSRSTPRGNAVVYVHEIPVP